MIRHLQDPQVGMVGPVTNMTEQNCIRDHEDLRYAHEQYTPAAGIV
jgi:hypothetical protein